MPLPSLQRWGAGRPPPTELSAVPHHYGPLLLIPDAQHHHAARGSG
ncbi:SAM-dependent methyltransferase, partial [Xanthomonas euvesicatoria]